MDTWVRELAAKHTFEVIPELYDRTLKEYETVHGYTFASAFDALNIAHSNGINISAGLENGTLRLITANERYALINLKKDDGKMMVVSAMLTEEQIEELAQNVEISDYVQYMTMDEWNEFMNMSGATAVEIIDSVDFNHFDTCDDYAVLDGLGTWVSADNLQEILEPFLDEMLQEFIDNTLS